MGDYQTCFTGCGNPGAYHTGETRYSNGAVVPGVLLCSDCWRVRMQRNVGNEAYQTGDLDGVFSMRAMQSRGSNNRPLHGARPWWWRPAPYGQGKAGLVMSAQQDPPVHCKGAGYASPPVTHLVHVTTEREAEVILSGVPPMRLARERARRRKAA